MKVFRSFLLVFAAAASFAWAQEPDPDPPARVGRISFASGTVLVRDEYYGDSRAAIVNWPVTSGNTIATMAGARAEVRIGSTAIRLDGETELEFGALDDEQVRLRLLRGTVAARVREPEQARQFELITPQGRIGLQEAGAYRFETGRAPEATAVTVFQGAAAFVGDGLDLAIRPGQRAEIVGSRTPDYVIARQDWDDFDSWCVARDRRDDESQSVRYVPREMTGYEDLDDHGEWRESADYGPLWYPRAVPADWAPYRMGHWAWVEPWGWTWIDDAPWGFAPFHYGRWVFVGGLWAWTPGPFRAHPVYAPALVAWIGDPGWHVAFAFGRARAVGWFPLGPREVFVPGYRCTPAYVRRVNAPHVTDAAQIEHVRANVRGVRHVHRFHPGAVTIAPADTVSRGERVPRSMAGPDRAASIGALPAVVAAPEVVPPKRRHRGGDAAGPSGRGFTDRTRPAGAPIRGEGAAPTGEPGATERTRPAADKAPERVEVWRGMRGRGMGGRDDERRATRRQAQTESAASVMGERLIVVPVRPGASPGRDRGEGARGPVGRRDGQSALPQPRATERTPPILGNPSGAQRDRVRAAPGVEPPRREVRGSAVRESREADKGGRPERESGKGMRARDRNGRID